MKMKMRTSQQRMPPYHSEIRQKLYFILVLKGIHDWIKSMTMHMQEKPMRLPPYHSENRQNLNLNLVLKGINGKRQ